MTPPNRPESAPNRKEPVSDVTQNTAKEKARAALDAGEVDMDALKGLIDGYVEATGRTDLSIESAAWALLGIDRQKKEVSEARAERSQIVERRAETGGSFQPEELLYAAASRCPCGAGLAYPKEMGIHGWWDCSAILTRTADGLVEHTAKLPFAFYEIKSEDQPSSMGATTRPKPSGETP